MKQPIIRYGYNIYETATEMGEKYANYIYVSHVEEDSYLYTRTRTTYKIDEDDIACFRIIWKYPELK